MVNGLCRVGIASIAMGLLDKLRELRSLALFCRTITHEGGHIEPARRVFEEIRIVGFQPNLVSFNTLINGVLETGNFPAAKDLLIEMLNIGLAPDVFTYSTPTDDDLSVMQTLHAVSMGAVVLPSKTEDLPDGELTYMRVEFERLVGSKDSETYYMVSPDGNSSPELSIFFVRI